MTADERLREARSAVIDRRYRCVLRESPGKAKEDQAGNTQSRSFTRLFYHLID